MQPLSAMDLLAVWEENWRRPPLWQGLALLTAACPEERQETLLALPMGVFNARLLTLYAWTFGPSLTAVTTCSGCGGVVEATLSAADLCASESEPPPWLEVGSEAGVVRFRLPTPGDLLAAGDTATVDGAAQLLLARCLETPSHPLPPAIAVDLTAAMEDADPLAVIELSGACPHCGSPWSAFLDVASYLWREVQTWAQRTLYEIHLLARVYGWHEADILALTPLRRQAYLQMIYG